MSTVTHWDVIIPRDLLSPSAMIPLFCMRITTQQMMRTKECYNFESTLRVIKDYCLKYVYTIFQTRFVWIWYFQWFSFRIDVHLLVQGIWLYNPIRCYGDFRHTSLDDDVRISFKMRLAWFALLVAYFIKNSVAQVLNSDFHYGYWYAICVIFTFSPGLFIFIFGPQQRRIVSGK